MSFWNPGSIRLSRTIGGLACESGDMRPNNAADERPANRRRSQPISVFGGYKRRERSVKRMVRTLLSWLVVTFVAAPSDGAVVALVGAKVYASPNDAAVVGTTVLIDGDRILAVGRRSAMRIPTGAKIVDCAGLT